MMKLRYEFESTRSNMMNRESVPSLDTCLNMMNRESVPSFTVTCDSYHACFCDQKEND